MRNNSLVSVIIPFLNPGNFLQEAIESVFAQIYKNWEILLIDDGSTDASTVIARKYAKLHPEKVRYLEHEGHQNRGKSTSRNLGINHSKGSYIAFLDADDIYLPEKLAQQVKILESNSEAGMVYNHSLYWYSWSGNPQDIQQDIQDELGVQPHTLYHPPTLLNLYLTGQARVPVPCSFLIRYSVIEAIGGFDESIQQLYEDQVLLAKVCLTSSVYIDEKCSAKYRQRDDSSWHISLRTGEDEKALLIYLEWLENYLSVLGLKDTQTWKILQNSLRYYRYRRSLLWRFKSALKSFLRVVLFHQLFVNTAHVKHNKG